MIGKEIQPYHDPKDHTPRPDYTGVRGLVDLLLFSSKHERDEWRLIDAVSAKLKSVIDKGGYTIERHTPAVLGNPGDKNTIIIQRAALSGPHGRYYVGFESFDSPIPTFRDKSLELNISDEPIPAAREGCFESTRGGTIKKSRGHSGTPQQYDWDFVISLPLLRMVQD